MKSRIVFISGLVFLSGCKKQVRRISVDTVKDLSGRFNADDSRMIAKQIIDQFLHECKDINTYTENKPVITVGKIRNTSHEHIDISTFMNDIERELINSGACRLVANRDVRDAIQAENESFGESDLKVEAVERNACKKLGVNRMFVGNISSIVDKEGKDSVRYFQFDIRYISTETAETLWIGSAKIKKFVKA